MTNYAYMFEAKGIQRYIFASGKLRDVVGASDLVAGLASESGDRIGELLDKLGIENPNFSRQAGGAFCLHHDDKTVLERVRSHWRLYVMRNLPGLEFTEGFGEGDGEIAAMKDAFANSSGIRSNGVAEVLPLGRPVHDYTKLTGRPHIDDVHYRDDKHEVDAITLKQRRRADELQDHTDVEGNIDGVALRFLGKDRIDEQRTERVPLVKKKGKEVPLHEHLYVFPRNLDPEGYFENEDGKLVEDEETNPLFPFRNPCDWWHCEVDPNKAFSYPTRMPEDRRYALVHADLSGLGELFQSFSSPRKPGDNGPPAFTKASENLDLANAIEAGIIAAAKAATETVLDKCGESHGRKIIPMRPILLGGDDITFIIRADLALAYAAELLDKIETNMAEVDQIKATRTRLSACAGIAIVRPGTPFLSANMLAESLCKFAKKVVKKDDKVEADGAEKGSPKGYPTAIAFHLQHQTAHESYEGDVWEEGTDATGRVLSANPFGLGARKKRLGKSMCYVLALAKAIDAIPGGHGTLRQIQSLLNEDVGQANARWKRWLEVGKDEEKKKKEKIAASLGCGEGVAACGNSAVYDALVLIDIGAVGGATP